MAVIFSCVPEMRSKSVFKQATEYASVLVHSSSYFMRNISLHVCSASSEREVGRARLELATNALKGRGYTLLDKNTWRLLDI